MKRILITMLAAVAVLTSCNKEEKAVSTGVGELTLAVKCGDDDYLDRPMVKSGAEVDVNGFIVTITKIQDEYGAEADWTRTWTVAEFPKVLELAPGRFNIKVASPQIDRVSTVRASYMAEQEFTIVEDVVTPLELVCSIVNMKVSIAPTDAFFQQLSAYTITVSANYDDLADPISMEWTEEDFHKDESGKLVTDKVAYFDVASSLSVMVTGNRTLDGSDVQLAEPYEITDLNAKDHHIINVNVQVVGELNTLAISLDSNMNPTQTDLFIDGFEEIPIEDGDEDENQDISTPYMLWDSNPTFATTTITDDVDVTIDIFATRKIKTFVVRVSDNFKAFIQVLTERDPQTGANKDYMDLINDKTLAGNLQGELYLPTGDEIYGKKYVNFSLSALVPLVKTVITDEEVDFILELTDFDGQELTKTLTFYSPKK